MVENSLIIEQVGADCLETVQSRLKDLHLEGVTRVRVEIDAEEPIRANGNTDVGVGGSESRESTSTPEPAGGGVADAGGDAVGEAGAVGEADAGCEPLADGSSSVITIGEGSDAYHALEQLAELDRFVESRIVRQQSPNFSDGDNMAAVLWGPANHGFVEKKPHPDDGRKNVYKITEKGKRVVGADSPGE